MTRPLLITTIAAGLLVAVAAMAVVKTMSMAGQFTTIRPLGGESCREVTGIAGGGDIAIDRAAGVAYLSATDRAAARRGEAVRGAILTLDMSTSTDQPALRPVTGDGPEDFRPAGISIWRAADGEQRLFAVNRRRAGAPTVEIFAVGDGSLTHVRTVADPLISSPNDVHAVGPDRFYVTNDGGHGAMRVVDFALQRLRSEVVYFDGTAARVVAGGFGFANGINASRDGATVYVTDTFTRRLRFFEPAPQTGALTQTGSLVFGTGLDNIDVDGDGTLWIAAHPRLLDLALYLGGWSKSAPSQVIRAVPAENGGEARTALLDLGERLSASSVAASYSGRYLVGSPVDTRILICPIGPAA